MRARKREAALPVRGMLGGVDAGEGGGVEAFALHLVEELGEAVGEVEGGGAGGEAGLGRGEPGDEPRELELAAQRRDRRRELGGAERVVGELGDDADARQEARGARRRERPRACAARGGC